MIDIQMTLLPPAAAILLILIVVFWPRGKRK